MEEMYSSFLRMYSIAPRKYRVVHTNLLLTLPILCTPWLMGQMLHLQIFFSDSTFL